jgi:hypothetical protein
MSPKKVEAMAAQWLKGNQSERTRIQHELRGSTGLNLLLDSISKKLPAQAAVPAAEQTAAPAAETAAAA